jgi:hypothetical protein
VTDALILAETNSRTLKDDPVPVVSKIGQYLKPNALIGILFILFILSILLMGFLMLKDVQTPSFFPSESIDFGKIEK